MKNNPITLLLVALACCSALVTALVSLWLVLSVKQMNGLQYQVNEYSQQIRVAQMLANEATEYAKRNPAMNEVLQSYKSRPQTAAPSAPSGALPGVPATK